MTARNLRNSDFPTNPPGRGTGEKTSPIHGAKDEVASARIVTADVSPLLVLLTYPWGVGGLYIANEGCLTNI
jgi:hypothetical protein